MKTQKIILAALMALSVMSCSNDDDSIKDQGFVLNANDLQGEITEGTVTLDASATYKLTAGLTVEDGATLEIPAGTRIEATGGTSAYIFVKQGGKINIKGTSTNPVVMTSAEAAPKPADWGGLVICGKAPINTGNAAGTSLTEVLSQPYGGSEPTDNSGSIKYLRVEYAGATFNSEQQFSGVSLYGVGSGTTFEYVESYESGDNGILMLGGTVDCKYMLSINAVDDGIDFQDGWIGKAENWYVLGAIQAGIEISNNGEQLDMEPFTAPATFTNITVVQGDGTDIGLEGAIYLKTGGAKFNTTNLYVDGFDTTGVIRIVDKDQAIENIIEAGELTFNPVQHNSSTPVFFENYTTPSSFFVEANNTGAGNGKDYPTWSNGWRKDQ